MKLGVFGGTFDPVHRGHLTIAREARDRFRLDRLLVVPSWQPPHKPGRVLTPWCHRFAMAVLATMDLDRVEVSPDEGSRPGPSFTVDTLESLRGEIGPRAPLFFVLGSDSLAELPSWKEYRRILDLAHLIVAPRHGTDRERARTGLGDEMARRIRDLGQGGLAGGSLPPAGQIFWLDLDAPAVSGSEIRRRMTEGEAIGDLVPPAVAVYISKYRIYPAPRSPESTR